MLIPTSPYSTNTEGGQTDQLQFWKKTTLSRVCGIGAGGKMLVRDQQSESLLTFSNLNALDTWPLPYAYVH